MTDTDQPSGAPSRRPLETDVDRGFLVGVVAGLAMFFVFQAAICGLMQTGVVAGDMGALEPLRYAGFTQFIYVFPSVLLFVNRKTPRMAMGMAVVALAILVTNLIVLAL